MAASVIREPVAAHNGRPHEKRVEQRQAETMTVLRRELA